MTFPTDLIQQMFAVTTENDFNLTALKVFQFQAKKNPVYKEYIHLLKINPNTISHYSEIPFLPIEFYKSKKIVSTNKKEELIFTSSGTTGMETSKHYVCDLTLYEHSFLKSFELFYGNPEQYVFLGLLPSYLERKGSSLIYMVDKLIKQSKKIESGFYLNEYDKLIDKINMLESEKQQTILIGVSYALLDLIEKYQFNLKNTIIIETGGMKGRRKEMIKSALHDELKKGFGVEQIHSEYGMTELLSQAYSQKNERFDCPPWMKILIRDAYDPFSILDNEKSGGINVIDLANLYSCSFIETKDLGKTNHDGSFEVLGRFDNSDIRGCNLMVQ